MRRASEAMLGSREQVEDGDAKDELEHERTRVEADARMAHAGGVDEQRHRHDSETAGERRAARRNGERQRERGVEVHLVVERPPEDQRRRHPRIRGFARNEEQRAEQLHVVGASGSKKMRCGGGYGEDRKRRGPVRGDDANDTPEQKAACPERRRRVRRPRRGVGDDEAADDEEQIDAVRPNVEGQVQPRVGRGVEVNDGERRDRAQQVQIEQHERPSSMWDRRARFPSL
jgi:hypothetical protein